MTRLIDIAIPYPARTQAIAILHEALTRTSTWILDVGVICPGSQRLVSKGTDTIPGKAAALYDGKKTKTYSDQTDIEYS